MRAQASWTGTPSPAAPALLPQGTGANCGMPLCGNPPWTAAPLLQRRTVGQEPGRGENWGGAARCVRLPPLRRTRSAAAGLRHGRRAQGRLRAARVFAGQPPVHASLQVGWATAFLQTFEARGRGGAARGPLAPPRTMRLEQRVEAVQHGWVAQVGAVQQHPLAAFNCAAGWGGVGRGGVGRETMAMREGVLALRDRLGAGTCRSLCGGRLHPSQPPAAQNSPRQRSVNPLKLAGRRLGAAGEPRSQVCRP